MACIEFNRLCSNLINHPCSRFKVDEPTKGRPDEVPSDEVSSDEVSSDEVPSDEVPSRRSAVRRSAVPTKGCPDEVPSRRSAVRRRAFARNVDVLIDMYFSGSWIPTRLHIAQDSMFLFKKII
jgi:hypothetical protein